MESFGSKQNVDSAFEQESFSVEKSIERESAVLEKFRGKAKEIARVLLFVSALSAGAIEAKKAYAEEMKSTTHEQTQKSLSQDGEKSIDLVMVHSNEETSEFYRLMHNYMEPAQKEAKAATNAHDALMALAHFDFIIHAYPDRLPKPPESKEKWNSLQHQIGSTTEMKFALENLKKMKSIALDLDKRFGHELRQLHTTAMSQERRLAEIDRVINEIQWVENLKIDNYN